MFNVYGAPDLDIALDKGEIEYWVLNPSFQYSNRRFDTVGLGFLIVPNESTRRKESRRPEPNQLKFQNRSFCTGN
jgi:hypothetical protein